MAFDHDASEHHDGLTDDHDSDAGSCHTNNEPARPPDPGDGCADGNQQPSETGADSNEPEVPPRKRWATERDEPVTNLARSRNITDLDISVAVTPDGGDDVDSHINSVGTRIGVSKSRATTYCDVGTMLRRMPKILSFCRSGALPHERLSTIAKSIVAVSDDNLPEVERRFLEYLTPRKDFQALPGPRVFARELRRIVEDVEPISAPPDEDEPQPITGESYSVDNEYPSEHGSLDVIMRKDRLAEFDATVRAIRDAKIKAGLECSLGDALMAMSRGDFAGAKVTMNVYVDGDSGDADEGNVQVWLDGAGWLPKYLTKEWLGRAADVRLSSDSQTGGYVPTEAQKARVRGRDGQCRFPGCDVPAHRCQIDHAVDYEPGDGDDNRGVTATWNLQCLCQHHHNLKTSRHWRAVMHADGSVTWVDHSGRTFATTVPHGPIAHVKRQTFDQRATRRTSTIHGDNLRRMKAEADSAAAMERADIDAALRKHARAMAKFEEEWGEFLAGPLNSDDPDIAAEASALLDAADDGWPCTDDEMWSRQTMSPRVARRRNEAAPCRRADVDAHDVPEPPAPPGPRPDIPF